jgi:hypothetical protein
VSLQVSVDVEELVIQGMLRPDFDIQDHFGTRVYVSVPADPVYPLLRIQRVPGRGLLTSRYVWLDAARIQYDVWADTRKAAWRAADTVRSLLIASQGKSFPPHGWVDGITEIIAPWNLGDPDSKRVRYNGEVDILVRPLVA